MELKDGFSSESWLYQDYPVKNDKMTRLYDGFEKDSWLKDCSQDGDVKKNPGPKCSICFSSYLVDRVSETLFLCSLCSDLRGLRYCDVCKLHSFVHSGHFQCITCRYVLPDYHFLNFYSFIYGRSDLRCMACARPNSS